MEPTKSAPSRSGTEDCFISVMMDQAPPHPNHYGAQWTRLESNSLTRLSSPARLSLLSQTRFLLERIRSFWNGTFIDSVIFTIKAGSAHNGALWCRLQMERSPIFFAERQEMDHGWIIGQYGIQRNPQYCLGAVHKREKAPKFPPQSG